MWLIGHIDSYLKQDDNKRVKNKVIVKEILSKWKTSESRSGNITIKQGRNAG